MITSLLYSILKRFRESKNGFTEKEYEGLDLFEGGRNSFRFHHLLGSGYVQQDYSSVDIHTTGWLKDLKYVLSKDGDRAINFYDNWLSYPHTCEQKNEHAGTKYVIVEHRSGCFCTKVYHMGYTSNIGFTHNLDNAVLYSTHKDAEEALAEAIKDSPTKYQNPEDYEFSIEEVKLTVNVDLPKTYVCKDCGKVHPIEEYYVSTYCPDSWNVGVCGDCRGKRRQKEREAMYGRNRRGVYDYDSFD